MLIDFGIFVKGLLSSARVEYQRRSATLVFHGFIHSTFVFPARLSGFFVSFLFGKVDFFDILRQYKPGVAAGGRQRGVVISR